jgi:hypothetical protein
MLLADSGVPSETWMPWSQLKYQSVDSATYTKLKSLTNAQLQLKENDYLKKYLFYAVQAGDGGYSFFGFNNKCWRYRAFNTTNPQLYINLGDGCPTLSTQWGSFVYTNDNKIGSINTTGNMTWFIHPEGGADVPNIQPGTRIVIYQGTNQDAGNRIKVTINYTQAEYF